MEAFYKSFLRMYILWKVSKKNGKNKKLKKLEKSVDKRVEMC